MNTHEDEDQPEAPVEEGGGVLHRGGGARGGRAPAAPRRAPAAGAHAGLPSRGCHSDLKAHAGRAPRRARRRVGAGGRSAAGRGRSAPAPLGADLLLNQIPKDHGGARSRRRAPGAYLGAAGRPFGSLYEDAHTSPAPARARRRGLARRPRSALPRGGGEGKEPGGARGQRAPERGERRGALRARPGVSTQIPQKSGPRSFPALPGPTAGPAPTGGRARSRRPRSGAPRRPGPLAAAAALAVLLLGRGPAAGARRRGARRPGARVGDLFVSILFVETVLQTQLG